MATKTTEKTIRAGNQRVKITRAAVPCAFTFARGRKGEAKALEVQSFPFSAIPTWADAIVHAARSMADYE